MNESDLRLSIEELAGQVGLPVRTVRFYITEGLIPGPGTRGKGAAYGDEHLLRLQLVRRLADQRVPLTEIREQVSVLLLDEVRALLAEEERHVASLQRAARAPSPREYVSELLNKARGTTQLPSQAPPPAAPSAGAPSAPHSQRRRNLFPSAAMPAQARERPAPVYSAAPPPLPSQPVTSVADGQAWRHWELVAGVELHVRADLVVRHRELIERILRAVKQG
jgi:DNA-binding transcriptional MerR regulator